MKTLLAIALVLFAQGAGGKGGFGGKGGVGGGVSSPPSTVNYGVTNNTSGPTSVGNSTVFCNLITTGTDALGYTVNSISQYGFTTTSANLYAAIYTGVLSSAALVSSGASSVVIGGTAGWTTVPMTGTLAASTSYNICTNSDASGYDYYTGTGSIHLYFTFTGFASWPSTLSFTDNGVTNLSLYVTVTPN